ncbi:MAG: N-acetylmuramoyl-L-alanine amidase [Epsilonproteobacteria bacterium]|nr:N-acetylmuramoyl-L-alanine amidase [Campylobacterota bacterium]
MIRFFTLFFIMIVSLHALSDNGILNRADNLMKSASKSNHFRAYNDYKNLYLRAIMSDNKKLKTDALKGIVKSGNSLHIDVSDYASELHRIKPTTSYKKQKTKKSIRIRSSHKLKSSRWSGDKLTLTFDKKLKNNQINYFKNYDTTASKYKYVFDIHASMLSKSKNIRKKGISSIKLVQYKTNTLRLVFKNKTQLSVRFKLDKNKLIITVLHKKTDLKKAKKYTKKKEYTKKPTYTKRLDRNKTIVIDAGHGGKDPGAIGYKKYREKVVVFKIARELKKILRSRGYRVYMTRDRDIFIKLSHRTKFANRKKADIFVSIHANAVSKKDANDVEGIECYFLSPSRSKRAEKVAASENSADLSDMNKYGKNTFLNFLNHHKILASNKLAIDLQRGILGHLNKKYSVKDGGVREGPFWVLVGAQMPAVLVEVGFISNPNEARRLVSSRYQKNMALGMANGIERYFANNCK